MLPYFPLYLPNFPPLFTSSVFLLPIFPPLLLSLLLFLSYFPFPYLLPPISSLVVLPIFHLSYPSFFLLPNFSFPCFPLQFSSSLLFISHAVPSLPPALFFFSLFSSSVSRLPIFYLCCSPCFSSCLIFFSLFSSSSVFLLHKFHLFSSPSFSSFLVFFSGIHSPPIFLLSFPPPYFPSPYLLYFLLPILLLFSFPRLFSVSLLMFFTHSLYFFFFLSITLFPLVLFIPCLFFSLIIITFHWSCMCVSVCLWVCVSMYTNSHSLPHFVIIKTHHVSLYPRRRNWPSLNNRLGGAA